MDPDLGAGVELTPTCWGMHVDLVEEKPGQPHLTAGCTITAIDGHNLLGLANEDPKKLSCMFSWDIWRSFAMEK